MYSPPRAHGSGSRGSQFTNILIFSLRLIVFVDTITRTACLKPAEPKNCAMSRNSSYTIHPIQSDDVEDVMALLKKTFFIDEPMNRAVGLCSGGEATPCPELDEYCRHSLPEGLSLKAVDCQGNIVAAMISGLCPLKEDDDGNDILSQAKRCKNPKFQKILYILSRREEGARLWEKFPKDVQAVEVKVVATDPRWRRRGIMNVLLETTEELTRQRRIRLIRMDTSSAFSARSAERRGFSCFYRAAYKDIQMDGQPIIVPEPPHNEDRVNIKELY